MGESAKIMKELSENFYVSLGTTTSCVCILKRQRFTQFLWQLMWSSWFIILVNDLSVFKNLTRFCLSVPYALCIEKDNDKKSKKKKKKKILPS